MKGLKSIDPIPAASVGVGLKPAHYREILESAPEIISPISFFEIHAENFMGEGGPPHRWLGAIREKFSLSVHGVCLSIGGIDPIDRDHLARLKTVVDRYQPTLVSEHLAWSRHDGVFYNDLIAPPLTDAALVRISDHVDQIQAALGRQILIENPSQYLSSPGEIDEPAFLNELAAKTGCGILLDINNIFVSASNTGSDARAYIRDIDPAFVGEVHLAGHAIDRASGIELRIDDHGSHVSDAVFSLYGAFIKRAGARPTLVEWDTDIPAFAVLRAEAKKAVHWMNAASPNVVEAASHAHL